MVLLLCVFKKNQYIKSNAIPEINIKTFLIETFKYYLCFNLLNYLFT